MHWANGIIAQNKLAMKYLYAYRMEERNKNVINYIG